MHKQNNSFGENLIFLISQPRSGSTMLQRILGCHPNIYTCSETWLMLHPVYSLRQKGIESEYGTKMASDALKRFFVSFENGEEEYINSMRTMYLYIYECAKAKSNKKYFLDKTPRYYFIIPELRRLFPKAKFIFLLRNPVAVLTSIINTWIKENWFYLYEFKSDLIHAPNLIINGMDDLKDKCHVIRYENIIENPYDEIQAICDFLDVEILPEMVDYGKQNLPKWQLGDQKCVYQNARPNLQIAEKWVDSLKNPQIWRLARDYINTLAEDLYNKLGYDFSAVSKKINSYKYHGFLNLFTYSLISLLNKSPSERNVTDRYLKRINAAIIRRNPIETIKKLNKI